MWSFVADELFPTVLNMSGAASLVILAVLAVRLCLKKAPKVYSYALWAVVLFRLLCPVTITARFSLLGAVDMPVEPVGDHTASVELVHPAQPEAEELGTPTERVPGQPPAVSTQEERTVDKTAVFAAIWVAGMAAAASYSTVSYLRIKRRLVGAAVLAGEKNVWLSDHINTPFVLGVLRPKIYLPSTLGEGERGYILAHERRHIRRLDHIAKVLAFLALTVHWFNPLVWLAFFLSSRDMEMSCDEAVVKELGGDIRADYSASLLSLSTGRPTLAGTPLAFGEGDAQRRIRNLSRWKKPEKWLVLASVLVLAAVGAMCLTNPPKSDEGMVGMQTIFPEYDQVVLIEQQPGKKLWQLRMKNTKGEVQWEVEIPQSDRYYPENEESLDGDLGVVLRWDKEKDPEEGRYQIFDGKTGELKAVYQGCHFTAIHGPAQAIVYTTHQNGGYSLMRGDGVLWTYTPSQEDGPVRTLALAVSGDKGRYAVLVEQTDRDIPVAGWIDVIYDSGYSTGSHTGGYRVERSVCTFEKREELPDSIWYEGESLMIGKDGNYYRLDEQGNVIDEAGLETARQEWYYNMLAGMVAEGTDVDRAAQTLAEDYARSILSRPDWYGQLADDVRVRSAKVYDAYDGPGERKFCFAMELELKLSPDQIEAWEAGSGLEEPKDGWYGWSAGVLVVQDADQKWRIQEIGTGDFDVLPPDVQELDAEELLEIYRQVTGESRDWKIPALLADRPLAEVKEAVSKLDEDTRRDVLAGIESWSRESGSAQAWTLEDLN